MKRSKTKSDLLLLINCVHRVGDDVQLTNFQFYQGWGGKVKYKTWFHLCKSKNENHYFNTRVQIPTVRNGTQGYVRVGSIAGASLAFVAIISRSFKWRARVGDEIWGVHVWRRLRPASFSSYSTVACAFPPFVLWNERSGSCVLRPLLYGLSPRGVVHRETDAGVVGISEEVRNSFL